MLYVVLHLHDGNDILYVPPDRQGVRHLSTIAESLTHAMVEIIATLFAASIASEGMVRSGRPSDEGMCADRQWIRHRSTPGNDR